MEGKNTFDSITAVFKSNSSSPASRWCHPVEYLPETSESHSYAKLDAPDLRKAGQCTRASTELTRDERGAQSAVDTATAEVNVTLQGDTFSGEILLRAINDCSKTLA